MAIANIDQREVISNELPYQVHCSGLKGLASVGGD